jgi:hypothetical protein
LIYQDYIDRVEGYLQTAPYEKAVRKRQVWIEPKFGEIKQWYMGRRFRSPGECGGAAAISDVFSSYTSIRITDQTQVTQPW